MLAAQAIDAMPAKGYLALTQDPPQPAAAVSLAVLMMRGGDDRGQPGVLLRTRARRTLLPGVVSASGDLNRAAQGGECVVHALPLDPGVPRLLTLAKYAVAFLG